MADRFVRPPRQQPAVGTADPGELAILVLCLPCLASAVASGTGHCPALTLSNAVPWGRPEMDTFLTSQFLASMHVHASRAAQYCAQCSAAAAAKGARGACDCSPRPPWDSRTLPNAVPWVRPEVDTFLSSQLLVVLGDGAAPTEPRD